MSAPREMEPSRLRRICASAQLGFVSTAELEDRDEVLFGQTRANEAISLGLDADAKGYNIFATGPAGVGKRTTLQSRLNEHARRREAPGDWVYLHSFREPRRPIAAPLPTGRAQTLAADMRRFLEDARRELTAAFDSETYARRRQQAAEPAEREQEAALAGLRQEAQAGGIAIELTPAGVMTIPMRGDRPLTPPEFAQLPEPVRKRYEAAIETLGPRIQSFLTKARVLQGEARKRLRELDREVALFAIGHLIDELKQRYADCEKVVGWLAEVADDVIENLGQLQALGQEPPSGAPGSVPAAVAGGQTGLARYEVNVFMTHEPRAGAPVVIETTPTYPNLFGRIEHQGVLGGGFVTDHRMLRPGAIHRASGGYLMLPAAEVLSQPLLWRKLKEVLRAGRIRLENPAEEYALLPTTTLTPEHIDLDLKVVLVGSPSLYELAYRLDEDVRSLFRVKAEFDWTVPWDVDAERGYATFLGALARRSGLCHFDATAVARVIEYGARMAEDQNRLSTRFLEIAGIAAEASQCAARQDSAQVRGEHVEQAIEQKVQRSNLIEQHLLEMVRDGTLLLDFDGRRVGQVNGLSVHELGDYSFGRPVRITATAGPGRGALMSIERETELSGHIHDKGFLTLSGYLRERYGAERRIAIAATLTFEQSYAQIDGDSAASAELYALLSRLADVPLRQDIAVTGSVNQHGELQAIGGVNEKIEGFFRACSVSGLTGRQGVIIPATNRRHLMLSREVAQSVEAGRFHVWSAASVEDGLELLTDVAAGQRGQAGTYPPGTLHARIEERLGRWACLDDRERVLADGTWDGHADVPATAAQAGTTRARTT